MTMIRVSSSGMWVVFVIWAVLGMSSVASFRCNETLVEPGRIRSPKWNTHTLGLSFQCTFTIRTPSHLARFGAVPKITFHRLHLGEVSVDGSQCEGQDRYLAIVDGPENGGRYCGQYDQAHSFYAENPEVEVHLVVDSFDEYVEYDFSVLWLSPRNFSERFDRVLPELFPHLRGYAVAGTVCEKVFRTCSRSNPCFVQSPGFPGVYPRNASCRYYMSTSSDHIQLQAKSQSPFEVGARRCDDLFACPILPFYPKHCPTDVVRVYDGIDEFSPLIGAFCGLGYFPPSIVGTGKDLFVEFQSTPSGPFLGTGFNLRVDHVPAMATNLESEAAPNSCFFEFTQEALERSNSLEGIIMSVQHWYPAGLNCTYVVQAQPGHVVRLHFPSYKINPTELVPHSTQGSAASGHCRESLTLYDSAWLDGMRIIKMLCEYSKPLENEDIVSTGSSLVLNFVSRTGSFSGSSHSFWAKYDFFNDQPFGIRVPGTLCDEMFPDSGRVRSFASPRNTLMFKNLQVRNASSIECRYRMRSSTGLHSRIRLQISSLQLKGQCSTRECPEQTCSEDWDSIQVFEGTQRLKTLTKPCSNVSTPLDLPLEIISSSPDLTLLLHVPQKWAYKSYFKNPIPLFEAQFQFVHPRQCGSVPIDPALGELRLPPGAQLWPGASYQFGAAMAGPSMPPGPSPGRILECVWEWNWPRGNKGQVSYGIDQWSLVSLEADDQPFCSIASVIFRVGSQTRGRLCPSPDRRSDLIHLAQPDSGSPSESVQLIFTQPLSDPTTFRLQWKLGAP